MSSLLAMEWVLITAILKEQFVNPSQISAIRTPTVILMPITPIGSTSIHCHKVTPLSVSIMLECFIRAPLSFFRL